MTKAANQDRTAETSSEPTTLTEAEWDIIRVVWREQPCAAGTVQEALQASRGWAYSTVKTIMDRMVKKGLLCTRSIRNLQLFEAVVSEQEARRGEVRGLLRRAFDGAMAPMLGFLLEHEKLSAEELRRLREMIDRAQRGERGP